MTVWRRTAGPQRYAILNTDFVVSLKYGTMLLMSRQAHLRQLKQQRDAAQQETTTLRTEVDSLRAKERKSIEELTNIYGDLPTA